MASSQAGTPAGRRVAVAVVGIPRLRRNDGDVDRIVSAFCVEWRETVRLDAERLLERCPSVEIEVVRTMTAGNVVTTEWAARPRAGDQGAPRVGVTVADYDIRGRISRYSRYWASTDQPVPAQAA